MVLSQCVSNSMLCPILPQCPRCHWVRRSVQRWSTVCPRAYSTGGNRCTGPCPSPLAFAGTSSSGCGARGSATGCAPCVTRGQCWLRTMVLLMDSLKRMHQLKEHSVPCTEGLLCSAGWFCLFDCLFVMTPCLPLVSEITIDWSIGLYNRLLMVSVLFVSEAVTLFWSHRSTFFMHLGCLWLFLYVAGIIEVPVH